MGFQALYRYAHVNTHRRHGAKNISFQRRLNEKSRTRSLLGLWNTSSLRQGNHQVSGRSSKKTMSQLAICRGLLKASMAYGAEVFFCHVANRFGEGFSRWPRFGCRPLLTRKLIPHMGINDETYTVDHDHVFFGGVWWDCIETPTRSR